MKIKALLIILLLLVMGTSFVTAQDNASCKIITLFDGWARASVEGAPNSAIYGLVTNLSAESDTLLSVSTDVAETAELHEMVVGAGDVMQMRPIEGGIPVAAQSYQQLQPGGMHIMLFNLKQPLMVGQTVDLVLNFEHMGEVKVTVPVKDAEQPAMGDMTMPEATPSMSAAPEWPEGCAGIHVVGAWVRAAVAGMPNSAAYGLLVNLTDSDDILLTVNADFAAAELHEMTMGAGDVMQMRPIEGGLLIPAGGVALLQPGGKHIMLMGLTQTLDAGTTADLTLNFASTGELTLTVPVQEAPEQNGMSMSGG